jgi:hypothetical protein
LPRSGPRVPPGEPALDHDVGHIAAVDQEPAEASLISVEATAGHGADGPGGADQRLQLARGQLAGLALGMARSVVRFVGAHAPLSVLLQPHLFFSTVCS